MATSTKTATGTTAGATSPSNLPTKFFGTKFFATLPSDSPQLLAIWVKRFKRGPMDAVGSATLVAGRGLAGNADQGGRRQVTLLDEAAWQQALADLDANLDPVVRRANLLLRGVDLVRSHGCVLQIGEHVQIQIYNQTTPCRAMDEAQPGLQAALRPDWRGGAFGEVIVGGEIRVGDGAGWL